VRGITLGLSDPKVGATEFCAELFGNMAEGAGVVGADTGATETGAVVTGKKVVGATGVDVPDTGLVDTEEMVIGELVEGLEVAATKALEGLKVSRGADDGESVYVTKMLS